MAQAFSLALDSAFSLDNEVDHLEQSVDQKYVSSIHRFDIYSEIVLSQPAFIIGAAPAGYPPRIGTT
jgi:hypothetical protein